MRSDPGLEDRFIEPIRGRGKDQPLSIHDRLASFVTGQAGVDVQQSMFVAIVRVFAGVKTGWTKIKAESGAHWCSILLLSFLLKGITNNIPVGIARFQSKTCSIFAQFLKDD